MSDVIDNTTKAASRGFPTLAIITIMFVAAKLLHAIDWSWWLVFLPLYGPLAVVLAILAVVFIGLGLAIAILSIVEFFFSLGRRKKGPAGFAKVFHG